LCPVLAWPPGLGGRLTLPRQPAQPLHVHGPPPMRRHRQWLHDEARRTGSRQRWGRAVDPAGVGTEVWYHIWRGVRYLQARQRALPATCAGRDRVVQTRESIGFIGLGQMGMGMARNLLAAGYDVLAYDVATAPLERFVDQGGRRAAHPAQIGAACQRVLVMVVNGEQVEAVVQGEHGLLQTMTSGSILVCSTIALADLHRVAERAAAQGVAVIDSPVSGGVEGAAEGTLTIFCGGDPAIVEAHRPLLQVVGAHVAHLGPLGAGLVGKLANNLILGVGRLAIAEAMAVAKKAGVPLDTLYQTLKTCTADSRLLRALEGAVLRGEYPPVTFHAVKDLSAAVDSGRSVQQAMPVTSLSLALYQLADDKLGGLRTSTEVVRYFLED
jgi:3-hydroxyisobutyrate dehydrogenase-like beta-hydroxyacid dehydrogenase